MFAVRDKRTGKFLRNFSGSYNKFHWHVRYRLSVEKKVSFEAITREEVHANMWSLDTPNGAKLYKTESGIATAFYSSRYRREENGKHKMIPLAEALPWLEIVPVQVSLTCVS